MTTNDSVVTDPTAPRVYSTNSSNAYQWDLDLEGSIPAVLDPGDNHLAFQLESSPLANYTERQSILSQIATVTVTYQPRFAL